MLLCYGYLTVWENWAVCEKQAPGYVRVYYMQGGEASYESETEYRELKNNRLYCFPSTVPYKITQNPQNRITCLYFHFNIAPYILSTLQEIDVAKHIILKNLLDAYIALCKAEPQNPNGAFQRQLASAIIEYLKKLAILEIVNPKIEKGVAYVLDHIDKPIKIDELSKYCGYQPEYFIRLFKECIGLTPHQFIISCRMKNAMVMLQNGASVTITAEAVGYKESKNFSKAFREFYGITPRKIKKAETSQGFFV